MNLKKWLLKHLATAHPHPCGTAILFGGACGAFPVAPTVGEVREALEELEMKRLVVSARDILNEGEVRWGLTTAGEMQAKQ